MKSAKQQAQYENNSALAVILSLKKLFAALQIL